MAPRDLDRSARVLAGLAERWRTPNRKPRLRRILATPERFMLDVGDVLAYTMDGDTLRNPYVGREWRNASSPGTPGSDG